MARSRLKKGLLIGALVVLSIGIYVGWELLPGLARKARWNQLQTFLEAPKGKLEPDQSRLAGQLLSRMLPVAGAFTADVSPSHIFRFAYPEGSRVVVLAEVRGEVQAGTYAQSVLQQRALDGAVRHLRLCVFDETGGFVSLDDLPVRDGNRIRGVEGKVVADTVPLLQVHSLSGDGLRYRHYLTLRDRNWLLLRVEIYRPLTKTVDLVRNEYVPENLSFAPAATLTSKEDCLKALESPDLREQLAGLTWFIGRHDSRRFKRRGPGASVVGDALKDPQVLARLDVLKGSGFKWSREMAVLALKLATAE
jgi:hypothetical protein